MYIRTDNDLAAFSARAVQKLFRKYEIIHLPICNHRTVLRSFYSELRTVHLNKHN